MRAAHIDPAADAGDHPAMRPALYALLALAVACGPTRRDDTDDTDPTSDAGTTDAGPADAGTDAGSGDAGTDAGSDAGSDAGPADGGFAFDGGPVNVDCTGGGTCGQTECADLSGSYATCITCPIIGTQGPFTTTVTRVGTSCEFKVESQQGANNACAFGCAGPGDSFAMQLEYSGFLLTCTGAASTSSAALTCTPQGFGATCQYAWLPAGATSCSPAP